MDARPTIMTLSGRIYSLLLYAYPTPFRREYGEDMVQVFRDETRRTLRESGTVGLVGLWVLALTDLLKTALAEHIWEVFHMPMEKLQRWSGAAAATGGLFFVAGLIWAYRAADSDVARVFLILLFFLTMPLLAIGLTGFYRRLPVRSRPGSTLAFGIALVGLLLYTAIFVFLYLTAGFGEITIILGYVGFYAMSLGIAGMGVIAVANRSLGRWGFSPLLVAVSLSGFLFTAQDGFGKFVNTTFLILYATGWLLLGFALVTGQESAEEPRLSI